MTSYGRSSFGDRWGGGHSPYSAAAAGRTNVTEHDFDYISSGDALVAQEAHRQSMARPHGSTYIDEAEEPDILLLRYKLQSYELHFLAFSISDGILTLGDVRRKAAEKIGTDPRRLRLLYKGRTLRDDLKPAKHYGLKQQSELMCVVTSESTMNASGSDHSGSGEDSSSAASTNRRRRPRADSGAGVRPELHEQYSRPLNNTIPPESYYQNVPRPMETLAPEAAYYAQNPSPPARTPSHSPNSSPPPLVSHPPPADSNSPLGKVQALASTFHTRWVPLTTDFILHPPLDAKKRDFEYKKLNESILVQVLLKADEIDVQGDPEARTARKRLVKEAQAVSANLDKIGKS